MGWPAIKAVGPQPLVYFVLWCVYQMYNASSALVGYLVFDPLVGHVLCVMFYS